MYVCPKLENNTSVWTPYLENETMSIEKNSKQFYKKALFVAIFFLSGNDYLLKLNLKSLIYCRLVFGILFGIFGISILMIFVCKIQITIYVITA